jgi:hypothetical protein
VVIEAVFESRGPMLYAETVGLPAILTDIEKYRELLGPMPWEAAPLLVDLVRSRRSIADWDGRRET